MLETSGAANPIGMQEDIRALEELVRFDSITTVVDAEKFEESQRHYDVVSDQVEAADVVVLNKIDLVDDISLARLKLKLSNLNPYALLVSATQGVINPSLLYEFDLATDSKRKMHQHDAHHEHRHDAISSEKITLPNRINTNQMLEALERIPPSVFRIKGIVDLVGRGPTLVQFVGGRFSLSEFQNPNVTDRFLVLIGKDLTPVKSSFQQFNKECIAAN